MKSYQPFVWPRTVDSLQNAQRNADLAKLRGSGNPPAAPKELLLTPGNLKVTVSWTLPSEMGDIAGWRVYLDTERNRVAEVQNASATSVDVTLSDIDTHNFFLCSVNALGRESKKLYKQGASDPVASVNQVNNSPSNTVSFCTVVSVDAGSNATIRVYGAGGPLTEWMSKVGTTMKGPFPAGELTGYAYTTAYQVYYNPRTNSWVVGTNRSEVLADELIFAGALTTVAAGGGGGTTGGGGDDGGDDGCVEVGTPVEQPEGTQIEVLPCSEWVGLKLRDREIVQMHPDTLVSVWVKASELTTDSRIDCDDEGRWQKPEAITQTFRASFKEKRKCPGGTYRARGIRLHNAKSPRFP
jgi:hypothetical protein